MRILMMAGWLIAAWRWGDWRHWEKYHPTILYFLLVDLLQNFLLYQHPLWKYEPSRFFPNHTLVTLLVTWVSFPCMAMVYLSHFPETGIWRRVGYMALWVGIFSSIEVAMLRFKLISYHNGWTWFYSVLFDAIMFPLLRLHQSRPLLTYLLTGILTLLGLFLFHVPLSQMK